MRREEGTHPSTAKQKEVLFVDTDTKHLHSASAQKKERENRNHSVFHGAQ